MEQPEPISFADRATTDGNRPFWTPQSVQQVTGGRWLVQPQDSNALLTGASIDTRTIRTGQLYIAVQGNRFDGHDFLDLACAGGAQILVVSDPQKAIGLAYANKGVLLVGDTLVALQDLARAYRARLRRRGAVVIAVTGSNGKTTTRHLIHSVLSAKCVGSQSPKSFNNHIGVPLTLLAAKLTDAFVVAELGSNSPGEIESLAALVQPDIAVITNVGAAHLGTLGSTEAIAAEKASLLKHVRAGGLAVVPGDEPLLIPHLGALPHEVSLLRFGCQAGNDLRLTRCDPKNSGLVFTVINENDTTSGRSSQFQIPLLGRHNAVNALAAICIGHWMGLPDSLIADALSRVSGVHMRLNVAHKGAIGSPFVVINDAYNANPDSVMAAVQALVDYPVPVPTSRDISRPCGGQIGFGRRVLVLGDMLELGPTAAQMHRDLGRWIGKVADGIDIAILAGQLSAYTAQGLAQHWADNRICAFASWDQATQHHVATMIRPGDVVLIKGSRAIGLERLMARFEAVVAPHGDERIQSTVRH